MGEGFLCFRERIGEHDDEKAGKTEKYDDGCIGSLEGSFDDWSPHNSYVDGKAADLQSDGANLGWIDFSFDHAGEVVAY